MKNKPRKAIMISTVIALSMFAFTFAMVPLYNKLCRVTGLNTSLPIAFTLSPDLKREILVQFITANNQNLPWDFYPLQTSLKVHPEKTTRIDFYFKNKTNRDMIVQAIPSITPGEAVAYFHKIECFCFSRQTLKAGQKMKIPLVFRIDDTIPAEITTISLGYTLFDLNKGTV